MNKEYREHICPQCGKVFCTTIYGWGYHIGTESCPIPVCSYKCQREWETSPEREINPKTRKRTPVMIRETGETFKSIEECADRLDMSASWLSKCINSSRAYKGLHIERVVG